VAEHRNRLDPATLVAGVLFATVGAVALGVSADDLADGLRWIWPITLLVIGIAILVPSPPSRRRSTEDGAGDEIGAERGEDGEVEQAGGGHDG
jgi:hypothetical protein